jgi:anthranilate synthase component 1
MRQLTPSTFEEFQRDAEGGNVVAVTRSILADLQTPLGAFMRIAGEASHAFLLESIEGGERVARYSFLGANPVMVARSRGTQTSIQRDGHREVVTQNGVEFLRDYFSDKNLVQRPNIAPFAGGAVGYLAYDAARWFEPVLADGHRASTSDEAAWMFFRTIVAFDRVRQQMEITSIVLTDEAGGHEEKLRELYDAAVAETDEIEKRR